MNVMLGNTCVIINWKDKDDIGPLLNSDGTPMIFDYYTDALIYGKRHINTASNWKVVEIGDACHGF